MESLPISGSSGKQSDNFKEFSKAFTGSLMNAALLLLSFSRHSEAVSKGIESSLERKKVYMIYSRVLLTSRAISGRKFLYLMKVSSLCCS